jgi:hypothetical protein
MRINGRWRNRGDSTPNILSHIRDSFWGGWATKLVPQKTNWVNLVVHLTATIFVTHSSATRPSPLPVSQTIEKWAAHAAEFGIAPPSKCGRVCCKVRFGAIRDDKTLPYNGWRDSRKMSGGRFADSVG